MSTPQGDALRAQAETLVLAKPACVSMRDWYQYFHQSAKAAAYNTVLTDADAAAATLRLLADAIDNAAPAASGYAGGYGGGYGEGTPPTKLTS